MKKIIYLFLVFAIIACKNNSEKDPEEKTEIVTSEVNFDGINTKVPDEEDGGEMLLGKINFKGLQQEPFQEWFSLNKEGHVLDSTLVDSIEPLLKNVAIKVFMGTWCEDSQREIPALKKILDAASFDTKYVEMVAVTHDKDTPNNLEEGYEIEYVPTIIFFKNGAEINRIVEYPHQSLERDMLTILQEKPYKNPYAE